MELRIHTVGLTEVSQGIPGVRSWEDRHFGWRSCKLENNRRRVDVMIGGPIRSLYNRSIRQSSDHGNVVKWTKF